MPALGVVSRFSSYGSSGACFHRIIVFFMNLNVFSKFGLNMLIVVDLNPCYQFTRVNIPGDSILRWLNIEPEITGADHLHY